MGGKSSDFGMGKVFSEEFQWRFLVIAEGDDIRVDPLWNIEVILSLTEHHHVGDLEALDICAAALLAEFCGSAFALQHGTVTGDQDEELGAECLRAFQKVDMSRMENIESAKGKDANFTWLF